MPTLETLKLHAYTLTHALVDNGDSYEFIQIKTPLSPISHGRVRDVSPSVYNLFTP
jgi:hypothetical protein